MKKISKEYDYIIIGTGAGGATMAKELSKKSDNILVMERGIKETKIGKFKDAIRYFDKGFLYSTKKSKEKIILWRGLLAGGSAFVSAGNMIRCMEEEFKAYGIELDEFFYEAENELQVAPIAKRLIFEGAKTIAKASAELGWPMEPMRKAINPKKCIRCGNCIYGCRTGAKWSPLVYLEEAVENGVEVLYHTKAEKIQVSDGKVKGVVVKTGHRKTLIKAKKVILSAGGLETPVILQASGIEDAGNHLFIDLFVNIYGVYKGKIKNCEPQMSLLCDYFQKEKGFIISPFFPHSKVHRFYEAGLKGFLLPNENVLGLMVKIKDDNVGQVYHNGMISKKATESDKKKIDVGARIAKEILNQAGVLPATFVQSKLQGAHPGGTAAVGIVVDNNLETKIKNLYVCDASVFPESPGTPPILTIVALSKWLSKRV